MFRLDKKIKLLERQLEYCKKLRLMSRNDLELQVHNKISRHSVSLALQDKEDEEKEILSKAGLKPNYHKNQEQIYNINNDKLRK